MLIDYCENIGITNARENIQNKIQKEQLEKEKLETIINNNKDFYSLNLTKYNPKFTKRRNTNNGPIYII